MSKKLKILKSYSISIVVVTGVLVATVFWGIYLRAEQDSEVTDILESQAVPVQVNLIDSSPTRTWREFSGRTEAVDSAEIRPQVSGMIADIRFKDGQHVEKGDVLFVIDPRPYKAAVQKAKAELSAARNAHSLAESVFKRAKELIKTAAISKRIFDKRENNVLVTQATVKALEAQLKQAEINLDFAFVKAPITGQISRAEIKLGNIVSHGANAPLLTTIVSDDGIYVEFEIDEYTYLNQLHFAIRGSKKEVKVPVEITVGNHQKIYKGFVHSLDNKINPTSGTIRARAFLKNENNIFLPGMFVSLRLGSPQVQDQIMVTERAIGTNQDRKFVYIVNKEQKVEYREINIGDSISGQRVITEGLSIGEMVISDGIIRIRPGMLVQPQIQEEMAKISMATYKGGS